MVAPGTQTVFQPATGLAPGFASHTGNAPSSLSRLMPFVGVYVESSAFTGNFILSAKLTWSDILLTIDGQDTTATLTTGLDAQNLTTAGRIGRRHFAHLLDQLSPDVRVRIAMGRGASGQQILFEGYPQTQTIQWSQRDQGFSISCLDAGQEHLRHDRFQQITGRWMRRKPLSEWDSSRPDLAEVQTQPPVFNPDGRGNMTTFAFPIKVPVGTPAPKFDNYLFLEDGAPDAVSWRYVDALRYVCLVHIARATGGPPISVLEFLADTDGLLATGEVPTSADPFVRRITTLCSDLSIQSLNSEEAIAAICDAAGLHYQIALRTLADGQVAKHLLRVFAVLENDDQVRATPDRAMGSPRRLDLPREAPFENLLGRSPRSIAIGNAAGQSTLSVDRRRITRGIYLGGPRTYETFLLLRPGWGPHPHLDNLGDQAARDVEKTWWLDQFTNPEYDDPNDGSDGNGIPNSIYHGQHPLHHTAWDVGRLWIFPDDYRWLPNGPFGINYARPTRWPAKLYSPYHPDDPDKSIYTHPLLGGGISHAANWVPRARRFGDLIRRLAGTTDSAPIVFINFNATDADTALDDPNWIRFGGEYKIDPWRSGILFDANNLISEHNFWVDNSDDGDQEDGMLQRYIDGKFSVAIANPVDLRVGCFAMRYVIGTTEYSYAGDTTFTLGASVTSYLYLDTAATLKALTTGWPTGDHIKLAKVVTGATAISSIEDWRLGNLQVGTVSNWWTILPTAAVNLNNQNLSNIAELKLTDATELTLAAGVIAATQSAHTVDTEADAASDDLVTITAPGGGSNQLLILRGQDAARVVTVKSTGNISLIQGDFVMDATNKSLVLLYVATIGWVELTRNPVNITQLQSDLDANGKKITGAKLLNVGPGPGVATLVGGAFTYTAQWMEISAEGGADDTLTTINGGSDGDWLWLFKGGGAEKIVVVGTGNILVREISLTTELSWMLLFYHTGIWYEFGRGADKLATFPDPDLSIPAPETVFISGALAPNTDYAKIYVARNVVIDSITAMVNTVPVGSICIVDLLADGTSIFANDGEKANIPDGGNFDVSAVKNDAQSPGAVLTIRTGSSVGTTTPAADLSVTINKRVSIVRLP